MFQLLRSTRCRSAMAEFFDFVESGAYDQERYWRPEDWRWKQLEKKHHPTFWFKRDGDWYYRAMFDILPLEDVAGWPVYVSLAEARAYANWIGKRLPTEAEFHRAAYYGPDERESDYPWGNTAPAPQHGNFDFAAWSPVPIGSRPAGASRWGVMELAGNGWELTDTPFAAFSKFFTLHCKLSRLFARFFRREAFCIERRFLGHGG